MVSVTVALLFNVILRKVKSPAMLSVEVYALAPLPPKLSAVVFAEAGTPEGLQFPAVGLQFPVVGAVIVPPGPSHAGSPPAPPPGFEVGVEIEAKASAAGTPFT